MRFESQGAGANSLKRSDCLDDIKNRCLFRWTLQGIAPAWSRLGAHDLCPNERLQNFVDISPRHANRFRNPFTRVRLLRFLSEPHSSS